MIEDERDEARVLLRRAIVLAQHHGLALAGEAASLREALVAVSIMYSSLGAAAGCTMHQLMGLLMETHKQTIRLEGEDEDNQ